MSIAEVIPGPGMEFERVPPQDIAAEQGVLGGMLLSKDAIADVIEVIRGGDFYRPAHEMIYDVALDLYSRGEPADAVTVSAELTKRGEIGRVGGAPYLHTLISSVPTAANAGYYARIVRERAILRRLVEAGTRITQLGYSADGDVDEVVDRAQAEVYSVTERRVSEDYLPLSAIMQGTLDEIEAIDAHDGSLIGVPTGFADLDALTNGLHPGQMVIVAARPAVGKALALDTPLPTPSGWTTMGEVKVGDELLATDGTPTAVVAATEVMTGRPCFEITFDDGTTVIADAEHQWLTSTSARPGASSISTSADIAAAVLAGASHCVENTQSLSLAPRELSVHPYVLGARLGADRSASGHIASIDPELAMFVEGSGFAVQALLAAAGVAGERLIPADYLRASDAQRRDLLAGILDTTGTVRQDGTIEIAVLGTHLAHDVRELLVTLGYRHDPPSRVPSSANVITFAADDDVFRIEHKRLEHKESRQLAAAPTMTRVIVSVRPVETVPVRCVEIAHESHLYLATYSMVPTHNSTLALDIARSATIAHNLPTVFFSLEMGRNEITMRLLSAEAKVHLQHMRSGTMREEDWDKLARRMNDINAAPLFIDDSPNMSMMEIRAKCRRLKQRHGLRLVIVDYLQLMTSGKRVESRQVEVSEFSRSMKLLAKELEVPVIAICQLNRGSEQRTDKKPMLSDLRESGCLTADTRLLRADNGAEISLGALMSSEARDVAVWAFDDRLKLVPRTLTHAFPSGTKPTFTMRLTSGREITATANHRFLTVSGWQPLEELEAGSRVGVARDVPPPLKQVEWDPERVTMLAHLIGDGSFVRRQPIRSASVDEENLAAVGAAASSFGITPIRDDYEAARVTTLRLPAPYRLARGRRNPIAMWLDELGLFGLRSYDKFIPAPIFSLPKAQVGLFVRHLWATDGSVRWDEKAGQARLYYATTSRRLADDLARLLLRFNVFVRIKATQKPGYRDCYHVLVYGVENQLRFLDGIGIHGARGVTGRQVADRLRGLKSNTNQDTVPREIWGEVRDILTDRGMSHREFAAAMGTQFCGSTLWKHSPSRARLSKVASVLKATEFELLATNDVYWDTIAAIEPAGEQAVYDATVLGVHNFVANGIAAHNSLEQDADVVMLLHREDLYERESPRAGEADIIVAKHRNGPTGSITVAFQGHYSRFVDMARG